MKYFYATENPFDKDNNPLPEQFVDKVFCADSVEFLKGLPDNCIDIVFTSPPYNFGKRYAETDDNQDWEYYFETLFAIFDECIRVLKYGGRVIVNVQPKFSDYVPLHHIISNYFMNKQMIWKGEIIWEKNNYNCRTTAWGSWKSPSSPYLKYTWEFLEIFCKGDLKKQGDSMNADIDSTSFRKWVVAKWSIAPEHDMKKYDHPAMFPEELVRRALMLFSFKNDIVLDPFNGTGTTCVVSRSINRKFVGVDISQQYCDTANERLHAVNLSLFSA